MRVLCVFVFLSSYVININGQICTERQLITKTVQQTYTRLITTRYRSLCGWRRCDKTKLDVALETMSVPKKVVQIKKFCCDGYITNSTSIKLQCDPICLPACENGYCSTPGVCECHAGYSPIPESNRTCVPICTKSCDHGTCVEPEKCVCDFGYHTVNETCVPICNSPCENGRCVAPDRCECLSGYRSKEDGTCYPHCSNNCPHGTCLSPENCVCDDGWQKKEPDGLCEPVCEQDCGHGTCVAPNSCECFENYTKTENGTCVPFCASGCPHGSCIKPGVCECERGWSNNGTECEPICEYSCGTGTCIAPNVCLCLPGYENMIYNQYITVSSATNNVSCVPKCHNCHGKCVAPEECVCDPPFVASHVAQDGSSCDCFVNCLEGAKVCDRTVCNVQYTKTTEDPDYSPFNEDVLYGHDDPTQDPSDYVNDTTYRDNMIGSTRTDVPDWIYYYIVAAAVLISIIAIIIITIIVKRKSICNCFGEGHYYVEGDKKDNTNETKEEVKYSDLLKSKATV